MSRWLPLVLLTFGCLRKLELIDDHGQGDDTTSTSASTTGSSSTTADDESSSSAADTGDSEGSAGAEASTGTTTGASTGGPPGTTTTGGPGPYCGDGIVDPHEECDDGNIDDLDDCVSCGRARLIFVTSILLQGGKINGIVSADAYCKSLANAAKNELPDSPIVDPGNFKALLATSTEGAERHYLGNGPYRLTNGLTVSRGFIELFTEPHENAINVDERSQTVHANVWTGFDGNGDPYPGIDFCGDWTDFDGTANFGNSDALDSWWLHVDIDLNPDTECGGERPIYCVEQE